MRRRGLFALLLLFSGLLAWSSCSRFGRSANMAASATVLSSMNLTVVGVNGTQLVLNEVDISGLTPYRDSGGYKNQLGFLKGFGNYTGVSLGTLCDLVGGLANTSCVKISAADNYSKTFTYAEVNGEFVTYDNATGAEVPHSQPLVPIAAYYFNDVNVSSLDGPLRMAIVGPEGLVTNSTYWVKMVVKIEIVDEPVSEFPSLTILSLLLLVISAAATGLSLLQRWRHRSSPKNRSQVMNNGR